MLTFLISKIILNLKKKIIIYFEKINIQIYKYIFCIIIIFAESKFF